MSSQQDSLFPTILRKIREKRQLSQSDLAKKAGLQPSAIAHFEANRRKPSFANIRALAIALKVSTDYLMGTEKAGTTAFRNEENLSDQDREYVQGIIDMMISKKTDS